MSSKTTAVRLPCLVAPWRGRSASVYIGFLLVAGQAQDLGRPWNCMSMLRLISLEMGENWIW